MTRIEYQTSGAGREAAGPREKANGVDTSHPNTSGSYPHRSLFLSQRGSAAPPDGEGSHQRIDSRVALSQSV